MAVGSMNAADMVEMQHDADMSKLEGFGGVLGVMSKLGSNTESGITEGSVEERKQKYGENVLPQSPPKGFWFLFMEAMKDTTVISLTTGIIHCTTSKACLKDPTVVHAKEACVEWVDGVAITVAVLLVGFITAGNDYSKEKQFRKLNAAKNVVPVKVLRDGARKEVMTTELVAGDIVSLETGDKIAADGLFLSGYDLRIDESSLTGESLPVRKDANKVWMKSGCSVTEGGGEYMVTCVGANSEWGLIMKELDQEHEDTPLQEKLTVLAENIGKLGTAVAVFCFFAQLIVWLVRLTESSCFIDQDAQGAEFGKMRYCESKTEADCTDMFILFNGTAENQNRTATMAYGSGY